MSTAIRTALAHFQKLPLKDAARQLLAKLGYSSDKFLVGAGSRPQDFLNDFAPGHPFDQAKALVSEWKSADLLFQLTDQELRRHFNQQSSLFTGDSVLPNRKEQATDDSEFELITWLVIKNP
jgi:hypothetical protein